MALRYSFGIVIQNEAEIKQAIFRKKSLPTELVKQIDKQEKIYIVFYKIAMKVT